MMSNDGLIIENMGLSHIHLAVNNQSYTFNQLIFNCSFLHGTQIRKSVDYEVTIPLL